MTAPPKRRNPSDSEKLCYLPASWGHKNPSVKWEDFQSRLPTPAEKAEWFNEGKPTNIGVICGRVSGGLALLCFNDSNGAAEFFGEEPWQNLLQTTFVTKSVRGLHVWLRSNHPIKSRFVKKGDNQSWLEIRSDGNFTVAPPSLHPDGVLYQAIGVDSIYQAKDLTGFIDKRLGELGLNVRETKEAPKKRGRPTAGGKPERSDDFNRAAIGVLLEHCAFIQHCRDEAATLSEPWWWNMVHILALFGEPGRAKIHNLSEPYPNYTEGETEQKIKEALKSEKEIGPHTCVFIQQDLGFSCPDDCLAKKEGVKAPANLATRLASIGLHIKIDGSTYFERLDLNQILSSKEKEDDSPPLIKTLASFRIEPKMRLTLEGEGERLETVLKTGEAEYRNLFKREAWNSKRQFLAALPSVDLQYYGTDKDTQAILAMVTSEELPIRRGSTVLGRSGNLWVLRDGVFSKDGWLENPELVYIPSELDFDRRINLEQTLSAGNFD